MFNLIPHRMSLLSLLGVLALPAAACTAPGEDGLAEAEAGVVDEGAPSALSQFRPLDVPVADYFIVTHPDYRRCAWPLCGGTFVARVNTSVTACADGTWQAECHMLEVDLAKLGLDPSTEEKVKDAFNAGKALVRGALKQVDVGASWPADKLIASEIWIGATGNTPAGHFSRVDDTGLVCVTYPCPTFSERSLNTNLSGPLDSVDLSTSGATEKQIAIGTSELSTSGLLVAGQHTVITGPAGSMNGLQATEFYLRVR